MNLRQFLEGEWQTVARVGDRLRASTGISLSERDLTRLINSNYPDAVVKDGKVRLLPPEAP